MDKETVLYRLLLRTSDTRQITHATDDLTIEICQLELQYFMSQVTDQANGEVEKDNIMKFLSYMKEGQLTQAKQLSSTALDDYRMIQMFAVDGDQKNFEFSFWDRLADGSRKKHLETVQHNLQQQRNSGSHSKVNATPQDEPGTRKNVSQFQVNVDRNSQNILQPTQGRNKNQQGPNKIQQEINKDHVQTMIDNSTKSLGRPSMEQRQLERNSRHDYPHSDQMEVENKFYGGERFLSDNSKSASLRAVYIADDDVEEQGPTQSMIEHDTHKSTPTFNTRVPVKAVPDMLNLSLNGNSSRAEIATQFCVVYNEIFDRLVNEIQEECQLETKEVMNVLSTIVQIIEKVCRSFANDQIRSMIHVVEDVIGHKSTYKDDRFLLKEFRRQNADLSLDCLYEKAVDEANTVRIVCTVNLKPSRVLLHSFIQATTNVIWYMTIQDEPMKLEYDCQSRDHLGYFESYGQKSGRSKQVIWPAVRAFDGGPIMKKGVALFD